MTESPHNDNGVSQPLPSVQKPIQLPSMLHALSKTSAEGQPTQTTPQDGEESQKEHPGVDGAPVSSKDASFTPQNTQVTSKQDAAKTEASPPQPQSASPETTEDKKKGGVTQTIREKLNFQDEKLWKRFSSRRLDLIDSMDLSSKKASEQDVEISNVANTLRQEYGYPPETAADFDRLVRAGIQSVRRNRKRIPRFKRHTVVPHNHPHHHHPQRVNFLAAMAGPMHHPQPHPQPHPPHTDNNGLGLIKRHRSEEDASMALQSLRYQEGGRTTLPSVTSLSLGIPADHLAIACDRFLSFVARSHSGKEPPSQNLECLGRGLLESSVAFMLERHHPKEKHDSLRETLLSESTTAHVMQALKLHPSAGSPGAAVSLSQFFFNLIGGCAKDFGFDAIVHALGNIYLEIVPQYSPPNHPAIIHATTSGHHAPPPPSARFGSSMPGYKPVTFRFMGKKMDFSFSLNETPPTLYELLENGIKTFHILVEDKVLHIRDFNDRELVKSDYDVKMVFSRPSIDLEFFFPMLPAPTKAGLRFMDSPSFQKLL